MIIRQEETANFLGRKYNDYMIEILKKGNSNKTN